MLAFECVHPKAMTGWLTAALAICRCLAVAGLKSSSGGHLIQVAQVSPRPSSEAPLEQLVCRLEDLTNDAPVCLAWRGRYVYAPSRAHSTAATTVSPFGFAIFCGWAAHSSCGLPRCRSLVCGASSGSAYVFDTDVSALAKRRHRKHATGTSDQHTAST